MQVLQLAKEKRREIWIESSNKVATFTPINTFMISRRVTVVANYPKTSQNTNVKEDAENLPKASFLQFFIIAPKPSTTRPASTGFFCDFAWSLNSAWATAEISSHRNCASSSCWVGKSRSLFVWTCSYKSNQKVSMYIARNVESSKLTQMPSI